MNDVIAVAVICAIIFFACYVLDGSLKMNDSKQNVGKELFGADDE